jgi:hypothetical protein
VLKLITPVALGFITGIRQCDCRITSRRIRPSIRPSRAVAR